jgi:hypothetical protein
MGFLSDLCDLRGKGIYDIVSVSKFCVKTMRS